MICGPIICLHGGVLRRMASWWCRIWPAPSLHLWCWNLRRRRLWPHRYPGCFQALSEAVVQSLLSPPSSSIQLIRTWLLELLVRGTVPLSAALERQLWEGLNTPLDGRQLLLIRGRLGNRSYFGINKTAYSTLSTFEQPCFIWGAACLPPDEYATWLGTVRPYATTPAAQLFLNWVRENQTDMFRKLNHSPADQSE